MGYVAKVLRWIGFLPLALLASGLVLQLGYVLGHIFDGGSIFLWLIVGAGSAQVFYFVVFRVAPTVNPIVKWTSVLVFVSVGLLALVGSLLSTGQESAAQINEPSLVLAYLMMLVVTIYHARRDTAELAQEWR